MTPQRTISLEELSAIPLGGQTMVVYLSGSTYAGPINGTTLYSGGSQIEIQVDWVLMSKTGSVEGPWQIEHDRPWNFKAMEGSKIDISDELIHIAAIGQQDIRWRGVIYPKGTHPLNKPDA